MRTTCKLAIGVLAIGLGTTPIWGGGREADVPLGDVPLVVRQAALRAVPGIRLEEAEVERERGRLVYDLEGVLDGRRYEIEVTEGGKVLEVEPEFEKGVPLSRVPRAARKAAQAALPGARLVEAESVTHEGKAAYEIDAVREGRKYEIVVTPEGLVVKVREDAVDEDDDDDDDGVDDDDDDGNGET